MLQFNADQFIIDHITRRDQSLFQQDLNKNHQHLSERIKGKRVLVIGGAGTIGSSFIKALLPYRPSALTVVDYSENGLTELTRDLRSQEIYVPEEYITYPFDFGSSIFKKMYRDSEFDIVACFAAHKHVRSEKDHLAIEAMIRNNVYNTKSLLELGLEKKPERLFSVSTDKAANPVNVMCATKKLMEEVLMAYSKELHISTARFANVAFSNGSLLFGFIQRIMKRQPLSAPNDVKRYFVSPIESGQLCLLACMMSESSDIFFPKLQEDQMMTFSSIAEKFLSQIGLTPDYCASEKEAKEKAAGWKIGDTAYPVYFFTTDTSGEKSYEEFYTKSDTVDFNSFAELGVIKNNPETDIEATDQILDGFNKLFENSEIRKADLVTLIGKHIPDFNHIETGKSLDQKM